MIIKDFIKNLYHDLLYDYYEYKQGRLNFFWDIVFHYGQWVFGFILANIFAIILLVLIVIYIEVTWQFFAGLVIVMFMWTGLWILAGRVYKGDRPTVKGVNSRDKMPKWLR